MTANFSVWYIVHVVGKQKWAEREAELECRVQELGEECEKMEREGTKEREAMTEQLSNSATVINRCSHCSKCCTPMTDGMQASV